MRRLALAVIAAAFLVPFGGPAHADECAAPETQTEINICAGKDFEKADARLNRVYKRLRKEIEHNPDYINALVTAQRAWIALRDADCAFQTIGSQGGSIRPTLVSECQAEYSRRRANQLAKYAKSCRDDRAQCPFP